MNSNENNLKVGQDVWINMSSFADDEMWVAGKVLGFTPKRIKCWNEVRGTEGFYAPHKVLAATYGLDDSERFAKDEDGNTIVVARVGELKPEQDVYK